MRLRMVPVLVLAVLGTAVLAHSSAQPFPAAQGGGQVVLSGEDLSGAGNTISFTAQQTSNALTGSAEYLETSLAGGGDPGRVPQWHGTPTCLRVDGNTAEIGGSITSGTSDHTFFALLVTDNGTPAEGTDLIKLQYPDSQPDCMADWSNTPEMTLARGNVTVNDG